MAIFTYAPDQIMIVIGGFPMYGLADGTFLSIDRNEDAYSVVAGADGQVARVKSNNPTATMTLTLMQTSESNQILTNFALLDQASNSGTFPILIKDIEGTTLIFSSKAWVQKMPTTEFSKDISNREWTIALSDITYNIGGNTQEA